MRPIGLTGGIATGKSTVSRMLSEMGAVIIDADRIAHDVVQKEKPALGKIIECFGKCVIADNGEIDRKVLGEIVFNDSEKKHALNSIVHPEVLLEMDRAIKESLREKPCAMVILDVPLLIESGMHTGMREVILVYVPEEIQLRRLIERDNSDKVAALARIQSQMPIEQKRAYATMIIDNSGGIEETRKRTTEVFDMLKNKMRMVD